MSDEKRTQPPLTEEEARRLLARGAELQDRLRPSVDAMQGLATNPPRFNIDVRCPRCGAEPGKSCVEDGEDLGLQVHNARDAKRLTPSASGYTAEERISAALRIFGLVDESWRGFLEHTVRQLIRELGMANPTPEMVPVVERWHFGPDGKVDHHEIEVQHTSDARAAYGQHKVRIHEDDFMVFSAAIREAKADGAREERRRVRDAIVEALRDAADDEALEDEDGGEDIALGFERAVQIVLRVTESECEGRKP